MENPEGVLEGEGSEIIQDVLYDEGRADIPIFKNATSCLVKSHPERLLRIRYQGKTAACVAMVVTACMYGEQVLRRGKGTEGSPQEIHDWIFFYRRPRIIGVPTKGPFVVRKKGFPNSYNRVFKYAMNIGVSSAEFYPWVNGRSRFAICSGKPWDGQITNREGETIEREQKLFIDSYRPIFAAINRMAMPGTNEYEMINVALDSQPLTGCIGSTRRFRKWRGYLSSSPSLVYRIRLDSSIL